MAIVLKKIKQNNNKDLILDSSVFTGVMGSYYHQFLSSLKSKDAYYMDLDNHFHKQTVMEEIYTYKKDIQNNTIHELLNFFALKDDFLNYEIDNLSSSEQRLLQYLIMYVVDPKIIIINEPFYHLDAFYKKKVIYFLNDCLRNKHKEVIIGSNESNIIYRLCKKVIFINKDICIYGDTLKLMLNKEALTEYNIDQCDIIQFISCANLKGNNLPYSTDINDLIKDVYKNV